MHTDGLAILARAPDPGRTKTRLARDLGNDAAARLARAFLLDVTRQVRGPWRSVLFVDPSAAVDRVRRLTGALQACPQGAGSVGARMRAAARTLLTDGAERVVVVGADVPLLDATHVAAAFDALHGSDIVYGPAADGGYYLVGLTARTPGAAWSALFSDAIPWGTDRALLASEAICATHGWSVRRLAPLHDVDTAADLAPLRRELAAASPERAQATRAALAELISGAV